MGAVENREEGCCVFGRGPAVVYQHGVICALWCVCFHPQGFINMVDVELLVCLRKRQKAVV